ncbi:MAG: 5-oxoprolinase subunit PxpA [Rariglobus sp.]
MEVIDLNCDLGEGVGDDVALMPLITSANIACGAHAGDVDTMRTTVRLALRHRVTIGAHPGFADREHFGRRELALSPSQVIALVQTQIEVLRAIALEEGATVSYVKPHGALYNLAARDAGIADAIATAIRRVDSGLWLYGLAGSQLIDAGRASGLRVVSEVFADRSYQADGTLTPRDRADALISSEAAAVSQVLRMVRDGVVRSTDGTDVAIKADTVCLHGDGPHAVEFARGLRTALQREGVELRSIAG